MTMPPNEPGSPLTANYAGSNLAPRISGMAITSMILGILSFCLSVLAGVPAIILGCISLSMINREPQRYAGKGFAITGIVTGSIGCTLVLVAILLPSLGRARELANRSSCAANISGILHACVLYANDTGNDMFPVTVGASGESGTTSYSVPTGPGTASSLTDIKQVLSTTPGGLYAAPNNDPSACLWILVLKNAVNPKSLLCKSDPLGEATASPLTDASGGYYLTPQNPGHNSYSIAFPWSTKGPGAAPYWRNNSDSSMPIMSDMALRQAGGDGVTAIGKKINSPNHVGDGQNVGFGDAHVEWYRSPFAGYDKNESIFHWGGYDSARSAFGPDQKQSSSGITLSEPPSGYDIFMVPQRDASGKLW
ncbi:MAG: DUF4190 domain-containing protein [Phycisphaerae bacterium]